MRNQIEPTRRGTPKPDRSVQCVTHIIHPKTLLRRRYAFFLELYSVNLPIAPLYLYDRHTPSLGLYIILHRQHAVPHLQTRAFRWAATGYFDNEVQVQIQTARSRPRCQRPRLFSARRDREPRQRSQHQIQSAEYPLYLPQLHTALHRPASILSAPHSVPAHKLPSSASVKLYVNHL